ncbi:hypothetical protein KIW84_052941 [Lathyrus oleraceus]|uniref:Uncharacterized protein n=1 Tax=Pisum sativum TaxID=3888 RepID=A0A9D4WR96_PEA|nr:hypothetical protein KIW84_052939 [Pisum sativum]KAI5406407.1 hypothetical protein KIW84_052941 [Pisum sativum]
MARKSKHTPRKLAFDVDNIDSSSGVDHEIETNYCSDEFGSNDPNAFDNENEPKYPRFKMDEVNKNYKFKVGLEFGSLEEFKEAITACTDVGPATQENPQEMESHFDNDHKFEMLAANLIVAFEATQPLSNVNDVTSEVLKMHLILLAKAHLFSMLKQLNLL